MMDSMERNTVKAKMFCTICHGKIEAGEEYIYNGEFFCEECCLDIRTSRVRKTHWQYLGSIKTKYLIPDKNS